MSMLASGMNVVGGLVVLGVAAKIGSDIVKSTGGTKTRKVVPKSYAKKSSARNSYTKKSYHKKGMY